jgi:hypothetical protein
MNYPRDYEHSYFQVIARKVHSVTLLPVESGIIFRAKEIFFQQDEMTFTLFPDDGEASAAVSQVDGSWTDKNSFSVSRIKMISAFTAEGENGDFVFRPNNCGWNVTRRNTSAGSDDLPAYGSGVSRHYSARSLPVKSSLAFPSLRLVGADVMLPDEAGEETCFLEICRII